MKKLTATQGRLRETETMAVGAKRRSVPRPRTSETVERLADAQQVSRYASYFRELLEKKRTEYNYADGRFSGTLEVRELGLQVTKLEVAVELAGVNQQAPWIENNSPAVVIDLTTGGAKSPQEVPLQTA